MPSAAASLAACLPVRRCLHDVGGTRPGPTTLPHMPGHPPLLAAAHPPSVPCACSFYCVLLFAAGPLGHMWWKLPGSTKLRGVTYLYWLPVLLIPRLRRWCAAACTAPPPPPASTLRQPARQPAAHRLA